LRPGHCLPVESNLLYRCARGFRFVNGERRFSALCNRNRRWESAPRCRPSTRRTTRRRPIRPTHRPTRTTRRRPTRPTRSTRTTRRRRTVRPTRRPTHITTRRPRRGCARNALPNAAALSRLHLRQLSVRCHRVRGLRRGECYPIGSTAQYRCRRGFRFAGRPLARFNSQCQRNLRWEAIPRCVRIGNNSVF